MTLRVLRNLLIRLRLHRTVGLCTSVLASVVARRLVRVKFDGTDWIHVWRGEFLAYPVPTIYAPAMCRKNLAIFFWKYRPQNGDTIIDVGAGLGTEVAVLSEYVGSDGLVIAIEADPAACRRLGKKVEALRLQNVKLLNVAVGAERGNARLSQYGGDGLENSICLGSVPGIDVKVETLDTIIDEHVGGGGVAYVKMNIEGAEGDALDGFSARWQQVSHWCISCHDFLGSEYARTHERVVDWFQKRGCTCFTNHSDLDLPHLAFYVYAVSPEHG